MAKVQEIGVTSFKYKVFNPNNYIKINTGEIRFHELYNQLDTVVTTQQLESCLFDILLITAMRGHTPSPIITDFIKINAINDKFAPLITIDQVLQSQEYNSKILDIVSIRGHIQAKMHLPVKLSLDLFENAEQLKTYLHRTGLWSFFINLATGEMPDLVYAKALDYLNSIAEMHRLLLKFCYVRSSILLSAKVNTAFGESWLYGEDTGKEICLNLLEAIEFSGAELGDKLNNFWKELYTNNYLIKTGITDNTTQISRSLALVDVAIKSTNSCGKSILIDTDAIKAAVTASFNTQEAINYVNKLQLFLAHYFQVIKRPCIQMTPLAHYNQNNASFSGLTRQITVASMTQSNSTRVNLEADLNTNLSNRSSNIGFSINTILAEQYHMSTQPILQNVVTLLYEKDIKNNELICLLKHCPNESDSQNYPSSTQRYIYTDLLVRNRHIVNGYLSKYWLIHPGWWFLVLTLQIRNIVSFIDVFNRFNATRKLLQDVHMSENLRLLVDAVLFLVWRQIMQNYNYYDTAMVNLELPMVTVVFNNGHIELYLNGCKVEMERNPQNDWLAALFMDKDDKIKQLGVTLAKQNELFKEQTQELDNTKAGLAQTQDERDRIALERDTVTLERDRIVLERDSNSIFYAKKERNMIKKIKRYEQEDIRRHACNSTYTSCSESDEVESTLNLDSDDDPCFVNLSSNRYGLNYNSTSVSSNNTSNSHANIKGTI